VVLVIEKVILSVPKKFASIAVTAPELLFAPDV
jgi:hypothetical protein